MKHIAYGSFGNAAEVVHMEQRDIQTPVITCASSGGVREAIKMFHMCFWIRLYALARCISVMRNV